MTQQSRGFSLIELLLALMIAMGLSMVMFQLFHQNERVIRDQTLIMEMQQTARAVASQIADEVRMAGQGVPVYAAAFDTIPTEASAAILAKSTANRIDFRAGLSNVETSITGPVPIDFALGVSRTLSIIDGSGLSSGKFVYVFADSTWLRAAVMNRGSTALTITPRDTGSGGGAVRFMARPAVTLDEAVSIYLNGDSVRRATANDMTDPASPGWSAANEIGKNFNALVFTYYDAAGNPITPVSLANRLSIARVDIQLTVQVAAALSDGSLPTYSLALRTIPRNVRIRSAH
jgi:prepilin-type N-terminal cleavage/methylation domain-containing protein